MIQTKSAKTHIGMDGAVRFTMLPFTPLLHTLIVGDLAKLIPDDWVNQENAFCFLMSETLNIECLDETNVEAQALADFWQGVQNQSTAIKWQYFATMLSNLALNEWWDARRETRHKLPSAPEILANGEPDDPNSDGSGGTPSTKNS